MVNKLILVIIILILLIAAGIAAAYVLIFEKPNTSPNPSQNTGLPVVITQENFAQVLQTTDVVQALPKDAVILLNLYNSTSDDYFVIKTSSITPGFSDSPDLIISLPSSYIPQFNSLGFCGTLQKAKSSKEMSVELKLSEASFLWKYRGMMKYRSCFGF